MAAAPLRMLALGLVQSSLRFCRRLLAPFALPFPSDLLAPALGVAPLLLAPKTSLGNSAPRPDGHLPTLRPNGGNPDRRCGPALRPKYSLEGCRAAAAGRHLQAAHRETRGRRVLAGARGTLSRAGLPIRSPCAWMSGWPRNITPRPCRAAFARLSRRNSASRARWPIAASFSGQRSLDVNPLP